MIFDLLTSPQGHRFDPRMKMLLTFCSAHQSVDLICHMTMIEKINVVPKVPPLGHDIGDRIKIQSDMFCIFQL